jgi:hypothetical protein
LLRLQIIPFLFHQLHALKRFEHMMILGNELHVSNPHANDLVKPTHFTIFDFVGRV